MALERGGFVRPISHISYGKIFLLLLRFMKTVCGIVTRSNQDIFRYIGMATP